MNVNALRQARGLNQPQLAQIVTDLGAVLHATGVSKIELADRRVDVDDLVALAIGLGVTPNRLLLTGSGGTIHEAKFGAVGSRPDGTDIELTPSTRPPVMRAWEWACGEYPLGQRDEQADSLGMIDAERVDAFRRENRPHDPSGFSHFPTSALRDHPEIFRQATVLARMARQEGVGLTLLREILEVAILAAINGNGDPSSAAPVRVPVVVAIVTSPKGVLIGRRNDGVPPWTFIAGEIRKDPAERPEDAAVREVKEETGLEVRTGEVIGRRIHPKTDRELIYIAAKPVRGTRAIVGDPVELAEVRWVSLAEADELMPDMFGPVRDYLSRTLKAGGR